MVSKKDAALGISIAILITVLMVAYAAQLSHLFYRDFAPFYDSSSYLLSLTGVLDAYHSGGLATALKQAVQHSGTVTLPFLELAFMAPFISQPERALAPYIQLPWLIAFAISSYTYFYFFRKQSSLLSIVLLMPFLGIAAVWRYSAGLSDFRMDLPLYILLGTTFTWFLSSRYTSSYWIWVVAGLFMGLTCLTRATTPIYAFICLAPLFFLRLILRKPPRRNTLLGAIVMVGVALLVSGWFYFLRFDDLYHYYFIWNTDANAELPISESLMHAQFAIRSIGPYSLCMALSFFFFGFLRFTIPIKQRPGSVSRLILNLDWESLWLGIAPVLFLVMRGAGLNPFVVMPSAFGLIMFLVSPCLVNYGKREVKELQPSLGADTTAVKFLCGVVIALFTLSALTGINEHINPDQGYRFQNMRPLQSLIKTVDQDAGSQDEVVMTTSYISAAINDTSLNNILRFDYLGLESRVTLPPQNYPPSTFNRITSVSDWEATPGINDEEKIAYLVEQANQELDYIVLPDEGSIENIRPKLSYVVVNRYIGEIKQRLLTAGEWTPVGQVEQVDHDERVQVYRNEQRFP